MKIPRLIDLILVLAYKLVLDISFTDWILPIYGYEPQYHLFGVMDEFKVFIGYLMAVVCMILYEGIERKATVTRFVMLIQLLLIIIPYFVLYGMEDLPTWHVGLLLLGYAGIIAAHRLIPHFKIRQPGNILRRCLVLIMAAI